MNILVFVCVNNMSRQFRVGYVLGEIFGFNLVLLECSFLGFVKILEKV